jgi:hypothetical protein
LEFELLELKTSYEGLVHSFHAAHSAAATGHCGSFLFLRNVSDQGFGDEYHAGDTGCILQGRPDNFGRVDDTLVDHVDELVFLSIVTDALLALLDRVDDDGTIFAGIVGDPADGFFNGFADDIDTG